MASVTLNPYVNFNGDAEEALNFYKAVFGGELTISRFSEFASPEMPVAEEHLNKVMHGALVADDLQLMAADAVHEAAVVGDNISISLSGEDEEQLTKFYNGLSQDGTIKEPLAKAPWGDSFGMFTDKFGINWLVNITGEKTL
jgi:PhnB protein